MPKNATIYGSARQQQSRVLPLIPATLCHTAIHVHLPLLLIQILPSAVHFAQCWHDAGTIADSPQEHKTAMLRAFLENNTHRAEGELVEACNSWQDWSDDGASYRVTAASGGHQQPSDMQKRLFARFSNQQEKVSCSVLYHAQMCLHPIKQANLRH